MLYFILWVILILAVIVSVPVVNALENKRRRELYGEPESESPAEEEMFEEAEPEGFGEAEPVEEEPIEVAGGDDFSAFDDEFK